MRGKIYCWTLDRVTQCKSIIGWSIRSRFQDDRMWFILSGHRIPTPSKKALFCFSEIRKNFKKLESVRQVEGGSSLKEQPLSVAQPPSHKQVLLWFSLQFKFSCQTISRVPKNPPKQREMKYVCIYDVSKFNTIYDQKKILTLSTSLVLLQIIHSTKSSLSVTQEPKRSIVHTQ